MYLKVVSSVVVPQHKRGLTGISCIVMPSFDSSFISPFQDDLAQTYILRIPSGLTTTISGALVGTRGVAKLKQKHHEG